MRKSEEEWDGALLAELAPDLARQTIFFPECESTNDEAQILAQKGVSHGSLVIAEKQTAGRGRRGQRWTCPPGEGIACSLVLKPRAPQALWARISLAVGLGVAEALDHFGLSAELKWPNDLWVHRRKICGILVEASGDSVIVGIGLNVSIESFPEELAHPATSILLETGKCVAREEVIAVVVERVLARADQIEGGFDGIIKSWNTRCALRDHLVTLLVGGLRKQGRVEGLSPNGELLLRSAEGLERILQADEVRLSE